MIPAKFDTKNENLIPQKEVIGTDGTIVTGLYYRIKSTKGTVLDDWGGKTGENSAALQPDNHPDHVNRIWQLIPTNEPGWYRIKGTHGTVLDDWGGKTGENSAALQPDTHPNSANRIWQLIKTDKIGWFRIKSTHNTVLDDWGGKIGENSASLQPDTHPNSVNRIWQFIPTYYKLSIFLKDIEFFSNSFDNLDDAIKTHRTIELIDEHNVEVDENTIGSSVSKTFTKSMKDSFKFTLNEKISCPVTLEYSLRQFYC